MLPEYLGPHSVGVVDFETTKTSLLLRLYYPSTKQSSDTRAKWLPDSLMYMRGYVSFMNLPTIVAYLLSPFLGRYRKPAFANSQIISGETPLPIFIFSHGLCGMRTTYSSFLGSLASIGFLVVAIEHSDKSGCITTRLGAEIPYEHPNGVKTCIGSPSGFLEWTQGQIMSGLLQWRQGQIVHRIDEIQNTVKFLADLNNGEISLDQLYGNLKIDPLMFKGRLDLENLVLGGHSFGAATALSLLGSANHTFKCSVILDPWMDAIADSEGPTVPYLTIQSESFHWKTNLDQLSNMFKLESRHEASLMAYIRETAHTDISDFSFVTSSWKKYFHVGGDIDSNLNLALVLGIATRFMSGFVTSNSVIWNHGQCIADEYQAGHVVYGDLAFDYLYKGMLSD